jgi:hypothetical protein
MVQIGMYFHQQGLDVQRNCPSNNKHHGIFTSNASTVIYKCLAPWAGSTSELYRPRDRHLSAKLVPTFAAEECRVVSATDPLTLFSAF